MAVWMAAWMEHATVVKMDVVVAEYLDEKMVGERVVV